MGGYHSRSSGRGGRRLVNGGAIGQPGYGGRPDRWPAEFQWDLAGQ